MLVLVGDVHAARMLDLAAAALAGWTGSAPTPAGAGAARRRPAARCWSSTGPGSVQTSVRFGAPGPADPHRPGLSGAAAGQPDLRRLLLLPLDGEHPRGQGLHLRPAQPRRPPRARLDAGPRRRGGHRGHRARRCSRRTTSSAGSRRCRSPTPRSSRCASTRSARWRCRPSTQAGLASTLSAAGGLRARPGLDRASTRRGCCETTVERRERGRRRVLRAGRIHRGRWSATPRRSPARSPRWARSRLDRPERPAAVARAVRPGGAAPHRRRRGWRTRGGAREVVLVSPRSATPVDAEGRVVFARVRERPGRHRAASSGWSTTSPYFAVTAEPDDRADWQTLREFGAQVGRPRGRPGRQRDRRSSSGTSGTATARAAARPPSRRRPAGRAPAPNDGSEHFPRTDPAVIMLIHDGGDLALLGRGRSGGAGRFSTLAGFVEPGESLEAAVAREVFEEVGVAMRDVRYLASQPWPFPASLMLGFIARLDGDPSITPRPGRDGRGRLVHPRRGRAGRRLDRRPHRRDADDRTGSACCAASRRTSRSRASSSTAGWPASGDAAVEGGRERTGAGVPAGRSRAVRAGRRSSSASGRGPSSTAPQPAWCWHVAFGDKHSNTDQGSAIATLGEKPAVGAAARAAGGSASPASRCGAGPRRGSGRPATASPSRARLAFVEGAAYLPFAYFAVSVLAGDPARPTRAATTARCPRRSCRPPGGCWSALVGWGRAVLGGYFVYQGARRTFEDRSTSRAPALRCGHTCSPWAPSGRRARADLRDRRRARGLCGDRRSVPRAAGGLDSALDTLRRQGRRAVAAARRRMLRRVRAVRAGRGRVARALRHRRTAQKLRESGRPIPLCPPPRRVENWSRPLTRREPPAGSGHRQRGSPSCESDWVSSPSRCWPWRAHRPSRRWAAHQSAGRAHRPSRPGPTRSGPTTTPAARARGWAPSATTTSRPPRATGWTRSTATRPTSRCTARATTARNARRTTSTPTTTPDSGGWASTQAYYERVRHRAARLGAHLADHRRAHRQRRLSAGLQRVEPPLRRTSPTRWPRRSAPTRASTGSSSTSSPSTSRRATASTGSTARSPRTSPARTAGTVEPRPVRLPRRHAPAGPLLLGLHLRRVHRPAHARRRRTSTTVLNRVRQRLRHGLALRPEQRAGRHAQRHGQLRRGRVSREASGT